MQYLPHTEEEIQQMLEVIGVGSVEELFTEIPEDLRLKGLLDLPPGISEKDLWELMTALAQKNEKAVRSKVFLGAGAYNHYIPKAVFEILGRTEFYTAYTPYQPEVSQGTLQAIFEYQTMAAQIMGTEIANASMYDGATGVVEAILMARRVNKKARRVIVSGAIHPHYRDVILTYLGEEEVDWVGFDTQGRTSVGAIQDALKEDTCAVVIQSPNFFGVVEDLAAIRAKLPEGVILIGTFTEALAFGIVEPPGNLGADIVAGEGQSLGIPLGFGGPYLGLFGSHLKWAKYMPGRLIGRTVDDRGNTVYVMTLAAREQHIRRAKATSNICTNVGLNALAAAVYLSLLGKEGYQKLSLYNHYLAHTLIQHIKGIPDVRLRFEDDPVFNEFVIHLPVKAEEVADAMIEKGILAGVPLGKYFHGMENDLLVCTTEMLSLHDLERYATTLQEVLGNL